MYRVSQKNWVLPNWAFADPASIWGEILNEICGKSSCIMLWVGNFNAFIGRFVDTALGAYRVWKGALKNKRLHKNKWFLKIIQTGINPTTPDLTGSTGFVTKNHKYFSPLTSRICKCFIWQNSVFFETPCILWSKSPILDIWSPRDSTCMNFKLKTKLSELLWYKKTHIDRIHQQTSTIQLINFVNTWTPQSVWGRRRG